MSLHSTSNNATFDRVEIANRALLGLKRQVHARQPSSITGKTIDRSEEMLGASGVNLLYAGYPYDPSTLNAQRN